MQQFICGDSSASPRQQQMRRESISPGADLPNPRGKGVKVNVFPSLPRPAFMGLAQIIACLDVNGP